MKRTKKTTEDGKKRVLSMSDNMKERYAEMFIKALDSMEGAQWQKPWVTPNNGVPCNLYRQTKPYRKSNAFWLTMLMQIEGWNTPYFLTKTQMKNEDGRLKYKGLAANCSIVIGEDGMPAFDDKGMPKMEFAHRFPVVFYKPKLRDADGNELTEEEFDELTDDEQVNCQRWFVRQWYWVYNIDQTNFRELYPEDYKKWTEVPEHTYEHTGHDDVLERMITGGLWRCPIAFGGHKAFYRPSTDAIQLPERGRFLSDEAFYGTAIHEMAHSTMKELKRESGGEFGSEGYATEEFVAELTSACVLSMLGIGKLLDEQHVAYVNNWRKAIRDDKDFIPSVIDHVQRAVNYILNKYETIEKEMETAAALPMAA